MGSVEIYSRSHVNVDTFRDLDTLLQNGILSRLDCAQPILESLEMQQNEPDNAVYFLTRDLDDHVTAGARLLPSTDAYTLSCLLGRVLSEQSLPNDPTVWELSHFSSTVSTDSEGRILTLAPATFELLATIGQFARSQGIARLVFVTTIAIERLLVRSGIGHRISRPVKIDNAYCVALYIETSTSSHREFGSPLH